LTRGRRRASSGRRSLTRSCLPIRRSAPPTGPSDVAAVIHHDDKRLRFSFGDQVVHDEVRATLAPPAGFVFTSAVLQIQHRVANVCRLVIIGRRIDEAAARGVGAFREVEVLAKLAMRDVL
jgi:hypothetical protein